MSSCVMTDVDSPLCRIRIHAVVVQIMRLKNSEKVISDDICPEDGATDAGNTP